MMKHLMQMITKRKRKYLGAGLLLTAIFLSALTSGCALNGLHKGTQDLTRNIPKEEVETVDIMEPSYESVNPRKELTEFSLEPVSYTHLDVYKRQPMRRQSPLCWRAWLRWERNICPC